MISGVPGVVRRLASTASLVGVLLICGCVPEGYPTDLKYPPRTDIIVGEKLLSQRPDHPEPPGQLDESLRKYRAKGLELKTEGETFDPAELKPEDRNAINESLEKHFGTPANPIVKLDAAKYTDDDAAYTEAFAQAQKELLLDSTMLEGGSKLYRRHCLHCHGVTGNGRGPTGAWLHPHPRDYRKGIFKFVSTGMLGRPSRNDLYRIIKNGVDYTSMPSFTLLSDAEIDQLISYVIHLSLRGQAEEETMVPLLKKEGLKIGDQDVKIDEYLQSRVRTAVLDRPGADNPKGWDAANKATLTPLPEKNAAQAEDKRGMEAKETARLEQITAGYKLFIGPGGCLACHLDFGRQSQYLFDKWGTLVQPRNLTAGMYRGGRRPIDFYWRLRSGIYPSTMPALEALYTPDELTKLKELETKANQEADPKKKKELKAELEKTKAEWTDANVWRIIAFVQAVPFPNMLPPDIKKAVYPPQGSPVTAASKH